jgi:hypothetical protein
MECVPHLSRQGQGTKRRLPASNLEDEVVVRASNLGPSHYGVHFLIRHWVSLAITRRSFSLLGKASALATKCRITLDQILCGENDFPLQATGVHRDMQFLQQVMLKPARLQVTSGDRLQWSDLPKDLLQAIGCSDDNPPHQNPDNRWICVREMKCGKTQFCVSNAFDRDIASWTDMEAVWRANQQAVIDLWIPPKEEIKYIKALIQQMSLHKEPGIHTVPTRIPATKVRLASKKIQDAQLLLHLAIVNLDHAYGTVEYLLSHEETMPPKPTSDEIEETSFWENLEPFEWTGEFDDLLGTFQDF